MLLDFDIARRIADDGPGVKARGSAHYMAPEQVHGEPAAPSMDLFALGATLYEAATDAIAFDTEEEGAYPQLSQRPVAPHLVDPAIPEGLDQAVWALLDPDARTRPKTAMAALALLAHALPRGEEGLWPEGRLGSSPSRDDRTTMAALGRGGLDDDGRGVRSRPGLLPDADADEHDGDRIDNYHASVGYELTDRLDITAYVLARNDRSSDRDSPIFLGLRSRGELVPRLDHWLELAYVLGREGRRRLSGIGVDAGLTYELELPLRPSLTAAYAFGSGEDDAESRVDRSFRQTGLQGNEGRFNGVTRFRYYGELFDPELNNLLILTHGVGIRPSRRISVDLVHHYYLQHRPSPFIRDAAIDADPSGRSRELGNELDLILGYRVLRNVDMFLALGWFIPGRAFPARADNALSAFLALTFTLP